MHVHVLTSDSGFTPNNGAPHHSNTTFVLSKVIKNRLENQWRVKKLESKTMETRMWKSRQNSIMQACSQLKVLLSYESCMCDLRARLTSVIVLNWWPHTCTELDSGICQCVAYSFSYACLHPGFWQRLKWTPTWCPWQSGTEQQRSITRLEHDGETPVPRWRPVLSLFAVHLPHCFIQQ